MTQLVTLEVAKKHLNMDHDADDTLIELYVEAASNAVINYCGEAAEEWVDSSGELIEDPAETGGSLVPKVVRQATLLLIGDFYKNRESKSDDRIVGVEYGYGHLPQAVISLLYHYRKPTLV